MSGFSRRRCVAAVTLGAALVFLVVGAARPNLGEVDAYEARAPMPLELTPGVEAAFPRESYAPGSLASLVLFKPSRGVTAQVFHAGPERKVTVGYNEMQGVSVAGPWRAGTLRKGDVVSVRLGGWPSALEQWALGLGCDGHIDIVRPEALHYIVGFTDRRCFRLRMNTDVRRDRRCEA